MTPDVRGSERVEWRNVYRAFDSRGLPYPTREECDRNERGDGTRIAVERITITERVDRFPVPEEGGR